jgi:glycine/D-amino acid oxidase-like deaminating enzyme
MARDTSNLWSADSPPDDNARALTGQVKADVAIIGGGITGLSASLHLAQAGVRVCLLEANRIGHGGSGRNVGLVNAGLWTPPEAVTATLGPEAGARLNRALADGPQVVFDLIRDLGIDCAPRRNGTLHCADNQRGLRDLQDRFRQLSAMGAPVKLLDAAETATRTGSPRFRAALWDGRAGTIQPLAFTQGLARAARDAGAQIYEDAMATGVTRSGSGWQVSTASGRVTAAKLIQATNAYGTAGPSQNGFIPIHFSQLATEPLPEDLRQSILPGGEGCWDTALVMSSFRLDAEGRLLIGALGDLDGFGGAVHRSWARRKLAQLYPQLSDLPFEYGWSGRIAMTPDHLPRVDDIGPDAISIHGYSGRGIAPGTVFGKSAVGWVVQGDVDAFPVAIRPPQPILMARARGLFYEAGVTLFHLLAARG